MSYVQNQLLPGERVQHRAHLHKIVYLGPALVATLMTALAVLAVSAGRGPLGVLLVAVGALPLLWSHITYTSSEFAVTDKRVIIKVGWIQRRTLETMLSKVEGIGVDQSVLGRLLGFGTITVSGTGGTKEQFPNIAHPLEFRRQVQAQVSAADDMRRVPPVVVSHPVLSARDERDCPYCAERILARARVCKHCGRDVEPAVAS
ncbi:MAG: PH domain-containing protein [Longimicrobiales bacterium]